MSLVEALHVGRAYVPVIAIAVDKNPCSEHDIIGCPAQRALDTACARNAHDSDVRLHAARLVRL